MQQQGDDGGAAAAARASREEADALRKRTAKQHDACERAIDQMIGSNRYIRHMLGSLNARGCPASRAFFRCEQCPEELLIGGYWNTESGVVLCENRPRSPKHMGRTMMHELIHAFDFCRIDMNPQSCLHMACTEIRAANLSGDCNLSLEVIRGHGLSFTGHKQTCVKRIATTSLMMNPGCREHAERSVELAWANCWPDLQPYDHIP